MACACIYGHGPYSTDFLTLVKISWWMHTWSIYSCSKWSYVSYQLTSGGAATFTQGGQTAFMGYFCIKVAFFFAVLSMYIYNENQMLGWGRPHRAAQLAPPVQLTSSVLRLLSSMSELVNYMIVMMSNLSSCLTDVSPLRQVFSSLNFNLTYLYVKIHFNCEEFHALKFNLMGNQRKAIHSYFNKLLQKTQISTTNYKSSSCCNLKIKYRMTEEIKRILSYYWRHYNYN